LTLYFYDQVNILKGTTPSLRYCRHIIWTTYQSSMYFKNSFVGVNS